MSRRRLYHAADILLLCYAMTAAVVEAFSVSQRSAPQPSRMMPCLFPTSVSRETRDCFHRRQPVALRAAADDDDDDDDDELDDASLGDWRKFRASLIDGGLPGETTAGDSTKTDDNQDTKKSKKNKSVAAQNEALLAQQNEQLAEEYRTGIWAHTIGQAEVGGLLCRMPLEAELYLGANGGYWKEKLDLMLSLESMDGKGSGIPDLQLDEEVDTETRTVAKVDQ